MTAKFDPIGVRCKWCDKLFVSADEHHKHLFSCDYYAAAGTADSTQVGGGHYRSMGIQPWDAMHAWLPKEQFIGYLRGNALKYLSRAGAKGPAREDYEKAQHYIAKLLEVL